MVLTNLFAGRLEMQTENRFMDTRGRGRRQWDKWRDIFTPSVK